MTSVRILMCWGLGGTVIKPVERPVWEGIREALTVSVVDDQRGDVRLRGRR